MISVIAEVKLNLKGGKVETVRTCNVKYLGVVFENKQTDECCVDFSNSRSDLKPERGTG